MRGLVLVLAVLVGLVGVAGATQHPATQFGCSNRFATFEIFLVDTKADGSTTRQKAIVTVPHTSLLEVRTWPGLGHAVIGVARWRARKEAETHQYGEYLFAPKITADLLRKCLHK